LRRSSAGSVWIPFLARVGILLGVCIPSPQSGLAQSGAMTTSPADAYKLELQGDTAVFTSPQMLITLKKGRIVRLFNRVTGSEYLSTAPANPESQASTGVLYAESSVSTQEQRPNVIGPTVTKAGQTVLTPKLVNQDQFAESPVRKIGPLSVEYDFAAETRGTTLSLVYALDPATGDLTVQQKVTGSRKGLSGIRWGLGPVICRGDLLIPAFNGMKGARKEDQYKFESSTWGWPMGWQIPLVIFADKVGGFWVHAEDPSLQFKEFMYEQRPDKSWQVSFTTVPQAPFEPHHSGDSVTWRVNTFAGSWTIPVDRYKKWAYTAYNLAAKESARPKWVDDIKLVVKHADYVDEGDATRFLDTLQRHVVPSETLLFLTFWKDDEEKQPIPFWIPNRRGIRFAQEARRRGFRVMYFANYIGIMPNHPKFNEFKDHFVRDPYSGAAQGWNLAGEWAHWDLRGDKSPKSDVKLYYVNPAYKPWRDYQIQQFKQLFSMSPGDGLFLDQAFLIFNDGNGAVDGQSMVEANLQFHREVAEALPGVALGGESINEITMQYESFCELHFLSLDLKSGEQGEPVGWWLDPAAFDRMVPVTTRFMLPHTRPIGYVGFPDSASPYYEGWRDALFAYGGIPTLTKPTFRELEDDQSEVRRVMSRLFQGRQ
jgi:Domain of unknown function (DUF6259)